MTDRSNPAEVHPAGREALQRQLRRQSLWLKDSLQWLLRTKVLPEYVRTGAQPRALDVGCGPGYTMRLFRHDLVVSGVDIDPDMVRVCRSSGLVAEVASAYNLPFDDGSFDVVYCTFLMLWLDDPVKAIREMARVSRAHVLYLAEPDLGSRIDHPQELAGLRAHLIKGMRSRGGDPLIGRKLRELLLRGGLRVEIGAHGGVWSLERLGQEFEDEWRYVEEITADPSEEDLEGLRKAWRTALDEGTLFQYSPIFYALGRKPAR